MVNELSVFFPAYNEEANIKNTVSNAKKVLENTIRTWEIIIVDDGSTDKTGHIADLLAKTDKRIKVVHHHPNRGYGGALKTGFVTARYPWVAFTDADGQFDFSEITRFLDKASSADLILGYRIKRADSFMRRVYTYFWALIPRLLFRLNVRDYSCGFKLIKKQVYESILPLIGEEKVTQIEMLVKAQRQRYKFAQVGVHHFPREFGKQTGANLRVVIRSITDLLKLWKKLQ